MEIIEKETQKNIKILKMGKKLERPLAQIQDILIELEGGPVVIEDVQHKIEKNLNDEETAAEMLKCLEKHYE